MIENQVERQIHRMRHVKCRFGRRADDDVDHLPVCRLRLRRERLFANIADCCLGDAIAHVAEHEPGFFERMARFIRRKTDQVWHLWRGRPEADNARDRTAAFCLCAAFRRLQDDVSAGDGIAVFVILYLKREAIVCRAEFGFLDRAVNQRWHNLKIVGLGLIHILQHDKHTDQRKDQNADRQADFQRSMRLLFCRRLFFLLLGFRCWNIPRKISGRLF